MLSPCPGVHVLISAVNAVAADDLAPSTGKVMTKRGSCICTFFLIQIQILYCTGGTWRVNTFATGRAVWEVGTEQANAKNNTKILWEILTLEDQWASYQIRKIAGCACAGNAGNVSPRRQFQRKPLVSDPGMHHGTCVTHVPWCMSGSLTCDDGGNVPGIPGACAPAILRIWQEAHGDTQMLTRTGCTFMEASQVSIWWEGINLCQCCQILCWTVLFCTVEKGVAFHQSFIDAGWRRVKWDGWSHHEGRGCWRPHIWQWRQEREREREI